MTPPARRVHTVRLQAESEALVRRGAILLEDALRTASLPEALAGRLLIFRSLHVGHIHSDRSAATLALAIERRVHEIARLAVHALDPSAGHAIAIYFHDDAEPFIALAHRLARRAPATAWFWPLAAPGFAAELPLDDALRLVLAGALQSTAGPAAALRLVESLGEGHVLAPLLQALRPAEGSALLEAFGWARPTLPIGFVQPAPPGEIEVLVRMPLGPAVATWAPVWGEDDARSIWLAAMALAGGSPGRLSLRDLVRRAQRILAALKEKPGVAMPPAGREHTALPPVEPSFDAPPEPDSPHPPGRPETRQGPIAPEGDSMQPAPVSQPEAKDEARAPDQSGLPSHQGHSPEGPPIEIAPAQPPSKTAQRDRTDVPSPLPTGSWPTAIGGLLLLIPILERLGIVEFLDRHQELLEIGLPDRILYHIARHIGAPETDPLLASLHVDRPIDPRRHYPFAFSERFHRIAGKPGPLVFAPAGEPPPRVIVHDASRRLAIGVIHGGIPEIPSWMNPERAIQASEARAGETDLDILLRSLLVAVRRFARQRVRIGLAPLVRRPGRVISTPTHVDILFDHRLVDIRVRRAGLDIDPGWVPWFGRVVRFHYLYGERDQ